MVALSRAARSTPTASPCGRTWACTAASVAPAPTVTWAASPSTGPKWSSRRSESTASPASGTPPPTRPVLPPWGTTAKPALAQTARVAATSAVEPGRTTTGVAPWNRPVQSIS